MAHAVSLAAIARVLEQNNHWVGGSKLTHDFRRLISRAIVHDDDFRPQIASVNILQHLRDRGGESLALVVGRKNKAMGRLAHGGFDVCSLYDSCQQANVAEGILYLSCPPVGCVGPPRMQWV